MKYLYIKYTSYVYAMLLYLNPESVRRNILDEVMDNALRGLQRKSIRSWVATAQSNYEPTLWLIRQNLHGNLSAVIHN